MSAMMTTSAPGPIPIPQQPTMSNPTNITFRSGHGRQPSTSTRPVPGPGSQTTTRRAGGVDFDQKPLPRVVGNTAAAGPSTSGPRVQIAAAAGQRPMTSHGAAASAAAAGPSGTQPRSAQPAPRTTTQRAAEVAVPTSQTQRPQTSGNAAPSTSGNGQETQTVARIGFPHAFERWEMLSSRWEGLTGYWVSKLEGNRQELSHLPLEQEMSRQITDLAAAGANLFQALIELQRLRAASERKFQRWFFETRADQERAREISSEMERTLRDERALHAEVAKQLAQAQLDKATAEKTAQEAQRELQISKEECRRAWEELGRREQEERERVKTLTEGHPTMIGGIQVAAMPMPGVPSRAPSNAARPPTSRGVPAQDPYAAQPIAAPAAPVSPPRTRQPAQPQQDYIQTHPLHHEPDISEISRQGASSTAAGTAATSAIQGTPSPAYPPPQSQFYQQPPAGIHDREREENPSPVSYATNPNIGSPTISAVSNVSDAFATDQYGNVITDEAGNPIYVRRHGDAAAQQQQQQRLQEQAEERDYFPPYDGSGWEQGGNGTPGYNSAGGGVGIGREWATHHHPTRLSDVLEEDERSTAGRSVLD